MIENNILVKLSNAGIMKDNKWLCSVIPTRNTSSAKFAEAVNSYVGTRRDGDG